MTCQPYPQLLDQVRRCLEVAGLSESHARFASEAICLASLRGTDSHGIRLLPHYLSALHSGRINVSASFDFVRTGLATGSLDANHGIGHAAVATAMQHAIELAEESGIGVVTVRNSSHCGAMAYYGLMAPPEGMIGLAFTNATPKVKVFNASQPFFGINPICFTAPMLHEEPFCYDASPTIMPNNRVKLYAERGEQLPAGVAADAEGIETLDPALARMLLPIGGDLAGYKGYGMAMVVDILCSLLSGMPNAKDVSPMYAADGANPSDQRLLGQMVAAVRIDRFVPLLEFKQRLQATADAIRTLPQQGDAPVMVPGDPEKKHAAQHLLTGVDVSSALMQLLEQNSSSI
jgi:hypothetical protein